MPVETDEVGHILVVDDDAMVRQTITNYLEQQNVPAASVSSRQDLSRHLERAHPSLILLDLRLGQENGLDVLKEIRSHSDVPIIIMAGHSREEVDRVVGLELGADDYLAKPFSLRELLARVRAVLRRPGPRQKNDALPFGDVRVRGRGRQVFKAGREVTLTRKEFDLLLYLLT